MSSGLFGAGVYFAESVSKADEYVKGKVVGGALAQSSCRLETMNLQILAILGLEPDSI